MVHIIDCTVSIEIKPSFLRITINRLMYLVYLPCTMLYLLIVWWGLPDFIMPQIDWWLRWLAWMLNQCHSLTSIGPSQIAKFMGPTWVLSAPDGSHVGSMILAIRDFIRAQLYHFLWFSNVWWHHDMDILLLIIGPLWGETTVTCVFPS